MIRLKFQCNFLLCVCVCDFLPTGKISLLVPHTFPTPLQTLHTANVRFNPMHSGNLPSGMSGLNSAVMSNTAVPLILIGKQSHALPSFQSSITPSKPLPPHIRPIGLTVTSLRDGREDLHALHVCTVFCRR